MNSDRRIRPSDSGVATVWAAGAVAVLLVLAGFGVQLGSAISTRHRVEAAADLAALAAAAHRIEGEPVACGYAARVATGMATSVVNCQLEEAEVRVELEANAPAMAPLSFGSASGRARAGPLWRSGASENGRKLYVEGGER